MFSILEKTVLWCSNPGFWQKGNHPLETYTGGIGLGWHLTPILETKHVGVWHNGATGGYQAFCGLAKDKKSGVIVLSNDGFTLLGSLRKHTIDTIGWNILRELVK